MSAVTPICKILHRQREIWNQRPKVYRSGPLAVDKTGSSGGILTLGGERIEPSPSEVHLGLALVT